MPGDPKVYRQHALACLRLAQDAETEPLRDRFASLAFNWQALAGQLEAARAAVEDVEAPARKLPFVEVGEAPLSLD